MNQTKPSPKTDPLDLSDAVMARPALVAIFDSVKHEIVLIAAAYPDTASDPVQAYAAAEARLEDFEDRLRGPLPIQREVEPVPAPVFHSPVDEAAFGRMAGSGKLSARKQSRWRSLTPASR